MHILVTGGGGYIGSTLVPHLLDAGHRVTALDRFYFGAQTLDAALQRHGEQLVLKRGDVRQVTAKDFEQVDAVVDLAGISNDPSCELDPDLTRAINLEGSVRVATEAQAAGVSRIVFASSCSVYGHGETQHLQESSPLHPVSLYAKCKAEAEQRIFALAAKTKMIVTALRFATLFGISGRTRFDVAINVMTKNAYVDRKITVEGGGRQWRPFVHVRDVAACIEKVVGSAPELVGGRVYNVGSDEQNLRILNLAYRVRDQVPGTEIVMAPTDPDLRDYNVSFRRIRDEFGFRPRISIDDGIREVLDGLRDGRVDHQDRRCYTLKQYGFLVEVERTYARLAIDGHVLS
jgi:nucleoside-diphosphate-sugar epimerase